jgi:hypothetical protein
METNFERAAMMAAQAAASVNGPSNATDGGEAL